MPQYSARISFDVTYHADEEEGMKQERARRLADTMLAVLRGSPKIKVIAIERADVVDVEEDE